MKPSGNMMRLHFEITEDEQASIAFEAADIMRRKFQWSICDCCRGNGRIDHPAFANGFKADEWDEMRRDFDHDGETSASDRYLRGDYDVSCQTCEGSGKVKVPDVSCMTYPEKRVMARHRQCQRVESALSREFAAEIAAERRMGC